MLLALHCVPLFDWHAWQQLCRTRVSCLTLFKVMLWLLLTTNGRGCSNAIVPTAPPKDACSLPGGAASCGAPWRSATAHGAAAGSQPAPLPVGGAAPAATAVSDGAACLMASLLSEVGAGWERAYATERLGRVVPACLLPRWPRSSPAPAAAQANPRPPSPPPHSPQQSRIFALLHTGLAFRYARWQHTAALQAVLVGVAAARSAADGVCARAELAAHAGRLSARQVAALLTGMHLLPVPLVQPGNATSSLTACEGAGGGGASCASEAARLLLPEVPPHVDACRLLLFWAQASPDQMSQLPALLLCFVQCHSRALLVALPHMPGRPCHPPSHISRLSPPPLPLPPLRPLQICLGLVLPVWLGILSEGCARISFALQVTPNRTNRQYGGKRAGGGHPCSAAAAAQEGPLAAAVARCHRARQRCARLLLLRGGERTHTSCLSQRRALVPPAVPQHPSEMSPAEKEQVLSAATSNDWMTAAVHLTLLWIALWHVLLAAAAAAGGAGVWAVSGGGTSAA